MGIKKHTFPLFLLIFLIFFVWHKILALSITGEGYWYFVNGFEGISHMLRFDLGAEIIMDMLQLFFKDSLSYYSGFLLIMWIFIGILFYFFVYEMTESKVVAVVSSLLFSINFNSTFEMLAMGAYQNFLQRVLYFVVLLPAFIFFIKFHKSLQYRFLFLSLCFFTVAIFSAHFNVFFLPFIVLYACGAIILNKNSKKEKFFLTVHALLFLTIGISVVYAALFFGVTSYIKGQSFFPFLLSHIHDIAYHGFRQLMYLTIPFPIISELLSAFFQNWKEHIYYLSFIVCFVYAVVFFFSFKREKKLRVPLFASILFLPVAFMLNMYMRSDNVQYLESGSRYLFVPSISFAILWGIFLYSLSKITVIRMYVYLFLCCWLIIQTSTIWKEIDKDYYKHIAIKESIAYVKQISPQLKQNSRVLLPSIVGPWGAAFCQKFYQKENVLFISMGAPVIKWEKNFGKPFDPKQDLIINYNYQEEKIIDRTKDYKKIIIE